MENKKETNTDIKTIILAVVICALVCVPIGILIGNSINSKTDIEEKTENEEDNTELASNLLEKFKIEKFISQEYIDESDLNKDLLELNSNRFYNYMKLQELTHYSMNPTDSQPFIGVKYNDFIKTYTTVFGKEFDQSYTNNNDKFIALINPSSTDNDKIYYDRNGQCNESVLNECYVVLNTGTVATPTATLSNHKIENNTIKGDVQFNFTDNVGNYTQIGTFELKYIQKDGNYYIESLSITSLDEKKYN